MDGYGNPYDRSSACKAGSDTLAVRTVDNCEWQCAGLAGGRAAETRGCGGLCCASTASARSPPCTA